MASKRKRKKYPSENDEPMPDDVTLIRATEFFNYYQDLQSGDIWLQCTKKPFYYCKDKREIQFRYSID